MSYDTRAPSLGPIPCSWPLDACQFLLFFFLGSVHYVIARGDIFFYLVLFTTFNVQTSRRNEFALWER